jgi:hypothetical protein
MIAEIYGKISSSGSNLSERLEDNLTGDFFGTLRYIPFNKIMKNILLKTRILSEDSSNVLDMLEHSLNLEYWKDNIYFWPQHKIAQLDVLIEFDEIVIGIEVKLDSGLSSDDDVNNCNQGIIKESINQLARESQLLSIKIFNKQKLALLILLAPEYQCYNIFKDVQNRNIIDLNVSYGYLSWESIIETLKTSINNTDYTKYENLMITDLISLLKRKNLEMFTNFEILYAEKLNPDLYYNFGKSEIFCIDYNDNILIEEGEGYYKFE